MDSLRCIETSSGEVTNCKKWSTMYGEKCAECAEGYSMVNDEKCERALIIGLVGLIYIYLIIFVLN